MGESHATVSLSRRGSGAEKATTKPDRAGSEGIDTALVARAVNDLNTIYASKALETACLIGEYVLDRFFDGNLKTFVRNRGKQASFRALARHKDLRFSATYLWTAVAVVGQVRELPQDVAHRLPLSHHRLLLPLKDTAMKRRLAKIAVRTGLSKRDLAREIERLQGHRAAGSKRKPRNVCVLKALSQLVEASEEFVLAASAEGDELDRSDARGTNMLLRRLEVDLDAVRCVVAMLRSRHSDLTLRPRGVSPGKQLATIRKQLPDD